MDNSPQIMQVILRTLWRNQLLQNLPLSGFDDVQFRVFSQNGEDGILLYIFSLVGTTNKTYVEICAGNGIECNTANLTINHGWRGLLFDGNEENVKAGNTFYQKHRDTFSWAPQIQHEWITVDNVNDLIAQRGVSGEIDLLSLDLDGNDYWVLKALNVISPRVIVVEYQTAWGPDIAITQRYNKDFHISQHKVDGVLPRCGASLAAFEMLLTPRGYRLVGCERQCFNAFFIREDVGNEIFPRIDRKSCFDYPSAQYRMAYLEKNAHKIDQDFWVALD